MTFEEIEWEKPFHTASRTVIYKRYADKLFWLQCNEWIEIEPNREYNEYVYV